MKERIFEILKNTRPEFDFAESTNFVEDGFLDSFDIVTIVSELENAFDVVIDGVEIIPENFESVMSICELIDKSKKNT